MAAWRYEISHLLLKKYFTHSLCSLVKYFQHSKRNFVSPRGHVISTMYFVTLSFELVPSSQECEKRSLKTRIKLCCTGMVLGIHITSGVIFLGLFVFPKGCVQVGTVKVHMGCVRIQLHW